MKVTVEVVAKPVGGTQPAYVVLPRPLHGGTTAAGSELEMEHEAVGEKTVSRVMRPPAAGRIEGFKEKVTKPAA